MAAGEHSFRYDHVFGDYGQPPAALYDTCVQPLVDGLFKGYNATVFVSGRQGRQGGWRRVAAADRGASAGVRNWQMRGYADRMATCQPNTGEQHAAATQSCSRGPRANPAPPRRRFACRHTARRGAAKHTRWAARSRQVVHQRA